jgi:hypothetical protein
LDLNKLKNGRGMGFGDGTILFYSFINCNLIVKKGEAM